VDNHGDFKLIHHPCSHQGAKLIRIAFRFIQDYVERGDIVCVFTCRLQPWMQTALP
jgi:hypothetical protein